MQLGEEVTAGGLLLLGILVYLLALRPLPPSLFDIEGLPLAKLQEIWRYRLRRGVILGFVAVTIGAVLAGMGARSPGTTLAGLSGRSQVVTGLLIVLGGLLMARDQWRCPLCYACLLTLGHGPAPMIRGCCPDCDTHFGADDTEARPGHD